MKIGDRIQIMDKSGNVYIQPNAVVCGIDKDTDGNMCVEVTGGTNGDDQLWYSESDYEIIEL